MNIVTLLSLLIVVIILERLKVFKLANFFDNIFSGERSKPFVPQLDKMTDAEIEKQKRDAKLKNQMLTNKMQTRFIPIVKQIAKSFDFSVNIPIVLGIIWVESKGVFKMGKKGEIGVMQITRFAIKDVDETFNTNFISVPRGDYSNIFAGILFLELQTRRMTGDQFAGVRAYNCGFDGAKNNATCGKEYALNVFKTASFIKKEFL